MTTTAHEDQFTAEPEHVTHRPYDTTAILRRNVADLELALKQQTERAEAAEAELKAAREQEPVAWMLECQQWTGDTAWLLSWSKSGAGQCNRLDGESHQRALYERPIPRERSDSIPAPATAVPTARPMQLGIANPPEIPEKIWIASGVCGECGTGFSVPGPAVVAAPAVPEEWRKFVGFLAQQTTFPHPAVCICQACTWIKKARALLQSAEVKK